ncbi:MAG: hypothetical protein NT070_01780, partial [Cyanobacteria bacterium]|nr:hypothetical protein [Cyanobacteriota bacterium]
FPCLVLPFLTTDTDWQDGQDGLDSDIDLLSNNHLDIFLHPFLFRTTSFLDKFSRNKLDFRSENFNTWNQEMK